MITVITPTGDRHVALERLKYYVERQTIKPDHWIISDDGKELPATDFLNQLAPWVKYCKRVPGTNKAKSFTGNLLNCIANIPSSTKYIIIMEDDDWYHETYIEETIKRFRNDTYKLVGQPKTIYYQVNRWAYRINGNKDRASLCETSMHIDVLPKLKKMCEVKRDSAFVDARLWKYARENKIPNFLYEDKRLVIGIKGMPGRKGIGVGHRSKTYRRDPYGEYLEKLIGKEDAAYYKRLLVSQK